MRKTNKKEFIKKSVDQKNSVFFSLYQIYFKQNYCIALHWHMFEVVPEHILTELQTLLK